MFIFNAQLKKLITILGVCFICSSLLHLQIQQKVVNKLEEIRAWTLTYLDLGLSNQIYQDQWSPQEKRLAELSVSHWREIEARKMLMQEWKLNERGIVIDAQTQLDYLKYWFKYNKHAPQIKKELAELASSSFPRRKRKDQRRRTLLANKKKQPLYQRAVPAPFTSVLHQKIYQEIRLYPPQHPAQIIAVKEVHQQQFKKLEVTAYWVAPCTSLCGMHSTCAQMCQEKMQTWDQPLSKGSMLIDAYLLMDKKQVPSTPPQIQQVNKVFLGRVALSHLGDIKVVFWSKKQKLLALTQKSQLDQTQQLYIFKSQKDGLKLITQLPLGDLLTHASQTSDVVRFRDLNDDGYVELIAPDPRFTFLRPQAIHVSMVYQITTQGLVAKPQWIPAQIPEFKHLRKGLLAKRQAKHPLTDFFAELLTFCLQNRCEIANEIVHLAYPQNQNVQSYWLQLKNYL